MYGLLKAALTKQAKMAVFQRSSSGDISKQTMAQQRRYQSAGANRVAKTTTGGILAARQTLKLSV